MVLHHQRNTQMCNVHLQKATIWHCKTLCKHYVCVNIRNLSMRLGFEQTEAKIYADDKCLCGVY